MGFHAQNLEIFDATKIQRLRLSLQEPSGEFIIAAMAVCGFAKERI